MGEQRKHLTAEEKVSILRQHFLEKAPVSTLCEQHGLNPTVFYRWQKEFFENGAAAFERQPSRREKRLEKQLEDRCAYLEAKLAKKDAVMAELLEEHTALKKSLGGA